VLRLTAKQPGSADITVETRTGNVASPEQGVWSSWTKANVTSSDSGGDTVGPLQPRSMEIASPPARFIQYRLTLTGQKQAAPIVKAVELAYVTPNLSPSVSSLSTEYPDSNGSHANNNGGEPRPATKLKVSWEASDPNDDTLLHQLEYRRAGTQKWLTIAKGLSKTSHQWQTRHVPDGRYILRLTTSDRRNNSGDMARFASRKSSHVVVDTTAPTIKGVKKQVADSGKVSLSFTVTDQTSPIKAAAYTVDGETPYQPVLAEDMIFDSTTEPCSIIINELFDAPHVITLRAVDQRGNPAYHAIPIER
jgi:hypothetical protein